MESPLKDVAPRVQKVLLQLQNEITIFERLMYKNANQHRRALYFRRLCQVRRDLRLVQAAHLTELIQNVAQCFGNTSIEPFQKGRWRSKNRSSEVEGFRGHLYGVARLLEQMCDPILHASSKVAGLLGQTFFMPFALTTLSILARVRVLVLQCLQDFVQMFNLFSAWALEKGHFDHNFHELPASLESKWDGTKILLAATFTPHQRESQMENEVLVEDCNGRKYTIFGSLVSGDDVSEHTQIESEGTEESTPSTVSLTFKFNDRDVVRSSLLTQSVEKSDACNSMKQPDVLAHEIDRKDKSEDHSTCTDVIPVSKKRVAYVSVLATSSSEAEKRKEVNPPLKMPKKDTLFDMLLGLGDQKHDSILTSFTKN
eukprot:c15085_g1_i1 orf=107-1216(+)